jgi:hypothetical protein
MSGKAIGDMTVQEIFDAVDHGMAEVSRRLESGELDGSGRYYTDEELAAGAADIPKGNGRSFDSV